MVSVIFITIYRKVNSAFRAPLAVGSEVITK